MGKDYDSTSFRNYKSPLKKLLFFFEKSRNQWKDKCIKAKYQIKLLRKKIKYLENNKKKLKEHISTLENELKQEIFKKEQMKQELDDYKKKFQ